MNMMPDYDSLDERIGDCYDEEMKDDARQRYEKEPAAENAQAATVCIYRSELDYISRCIMEFPNRETGGQLFGYWTREGVPVVCYALGPGRTANHQTTFFNQDMEYLQMVGNAIVQHFFLEHIGEWHSHHRLGLAEPSSHDATNIYGNMMKAGRERFLLCIGICDDECATINPFLFTAGDPTYAKAHWGTTPVPSPFRSAIDQTMKAFLNHPKNKDEQ